MDQEDQYLNDEDNEISDEKVSKNLTETNMEGADKDILINTLDDQVTKAQEMNSRLDS